MTRSWAKALYIIVGWTAGAAQAQNQAQLCPSTSQQMQQQLRQSLGEILPPTAVVSLTLQPQEKNIVVVLRVQLAEDAEPVRRQATFRADECQAIISWAKVASARAIETLAPPVWPLPSTPSPTEPSPKPHPQPQVRVYWPEPMIVTLRGRSANIGASLQAWNRIDVGIMVDRYRRHDFLTAGYGFEFRASAPLWVFTDGAPTNDSEPAPVALGVYGLLGSTADGLAPGWGGGIFDVSAGFDLLSQQVIAQGALGPAVELMLKNRADSPTALRLSWMLRADTLGNVDFPIKISVFRRRTDIQRALSPAYGTNL